MLSVVSLVCVVATWALLLWKIPYSEDIVYLHYNVFYGVDLTGAWSQLLWLPGTATAIWLVNSLVVRFDKQMTHVTKISISVVTAAMEVMLLVGAVLLILLNTD
jgi:hypothetical protein